MNTPFFKKIGNRVYIRLNQTLYPEFLIDKIKKLEPGAIQEVKKDSKDFLLELNVDSDRDYLDFLNYLIYHKKKYGA